MEDQKHTPPPYLVNRDRYAQEVQIWVVTTPPEEAKIATFHGDNREANAQFFMQAPELLCALKDLMTQIGDDYVMRHEIKAAREIISKAEGKTMNNQEQKHTWIAGELRIEIERLTVAAEYSNGEVRHQIEEMAKIKEKMSLQLQTIAESRIENERLTAEIKDLKAAQPFPVRL